MKLFILGTSGAVSHKERDNTSLLLESNGYYLLIDTPGSLFFKLKKLDINPFKVNNIFLTHTHPDHIYGIISFIHSRMYDKSYINILGHDSTLKFLKQLLTLFKLNRENFPAINYYSLQPGENICLETLPGLKLKAITVKHTPQSLGIKVNWKDKNLLFSSDTAECPQLKAEIGNIELLIHDCFAPEIFFQEYPKLYNMHTPAKRLAIIAEEAKVKKLIPIHFSGEFEFSIEDLIAEIKQNYQGEIILPYDGQVIELD